MQAKRKIGRGRVRLGDWRGRRRVGFGSSDESGRMSFGSGSGEWPSQSERQRSFSAASRGQSRSRTTVAVAADTETTVVGMIAVAVVTLQSWAVVSGDDDGRAARRNDRGGFLSDGSLEPQYMISADRRLRREAALQGRERGRSACCKRRFSLRLREVVGRDTSSRSPSRCGSWCES